MFEPVTITRSTSAAAAVSDDIGAVVCAIVFAPMKKVIPIAAASPPRLHPDRVSSDFINASFP
jgi:hypothetical protein